mmetsp:Transcript_30038/g.65787  ORF Transcript_30038/g.65787 Transcript_30038/m.65787 type:complete len:242 (-) Transcript_30038:194-919(-)
MYARWCCSQNAPPKPEDAEQIPFQAAATRAFGPPRVASHLVDLIDPVPADRNRQVLALGRLALENDPESQLLERQLAEAGSDRLPRREQVRGELVPEDIGRALLLLGRRFNVEREDDRKLGSAEGLLADRHSHASQLLACHESVAVRDFGLALGAVPDVDLQAPAPLDQLPPVHVRRRLRCELVAGEVRVVRRGDPVVRQREVHRALRSQLFRGGDLVADADDSERELLEAHTCWQVLRAE